jgi:riboflavin kinase/FMN adenylyltransferase
MKSVVAIGVFDGVHLGHQALTEMCASVAAEHGLNPVAATFFPHPMTVVRGLQVDALTSSERRRELLIKHGVHDVYVCEFSPERAAQSPEVFVQEVLIDRLHATHVVVGAGFRFGAGARGTADDIRAQGISVYEVEHVIRHDARVSSTRIRHELAAGNLELANSLLGREHRIEGTVIYGQQRGRELGYPTANIAPSFRQAIPADGVYAGWLNNLTSGERWPAAISIGTNPTFSDIETRSIEAFAIDQTDLNLYGAEVAVDFVQHLRPMLKFNGLDELVAAMAADVDRSRSILQI